eukprot:SAG11_NODE_6114_length_1386_cov_1.010878_1_plen_36_part_10
MYLRTRGRPVLVLPIPTIPNYYECQAVRVLHYVCSG